jgi:hypothetical protein
MARLHILRRSGGDTWDFRMNHWPHQVNLMADDGIILLVGFDAWLWVLRDELIGR